MPTPTVTVVRPPSDDAVHTAPSPGGVAARRPLTEVGSDRPSDSIGPGEPVVHAHIELILRIRVGSRRDHDLIVDLDTGHTVAELIDAIVGQLGIADDDLAVTSLRTGRRLRRGVPVGEADLLSGDELVVGPQSGRTPRARDVVPRRALAVDVIAGPDSGRCRLLRPGRFTIGRRRDCDVVLDDPSVSRHHADLVIDAAEVGGPDDIGRWRISIEPSTNAANGVTVNDVEVGVPTIVSWDDVIGLGGTRIALRPFERRRDEHVDRLGQIEFHRTPYRPPIVAERDTDPVGPIPERPDPRRLQVFAVLAPLAAGLLMYSFTRQVQFLALTLISPIVMVSGAIEDRRTGRRAFRRELAAFRVRLVEQRARFEAMRHAERIERLRSAPDLAALVRRAEHRTIDLWARGRTAPDLLTLRLGLGADDVRFPIALDRGGDADLRDEAREAIGGLDTVDHVPVTVDLDVDAVLGVHGEPDLVDGVVASLLVQAVTLHSPEDLVVAAAIAPERPLGWMKWLPHVRSVTSPIAGNHAVSSRRDADRLVAHLIEVAQFRIGSDRHGSGEGPRVRDDGRHWPRVLAVLDADLAPDPAEVSRLLEIGPSAGVRIVWLAATSAGVPRHASRILDVRRGEGEAMIGRLWSTDPAVDDVMLEVEHVRGAVADRVARALAPVRDASTASLATSIPRTAPLLDVLGVGKPTPDWIADHWLRETGYHLRFPIGIGVDGPLDLDLVHDGPHTLIGGTSGAGKSELLQSMVAALAARYAPSRLNFLFVDYKGGASSQVFERLPHTVGCVTNLSADLSVRALTSLRAELNRRMAVMEGRAKDLPEMIERFPDEAPPSLVIVVDEFATLVKEVPDFVSGIVDIAQRGRSLGIHLVLATQRPSGSVNENILANTNLRISLRMLDRAESSAIIDCADAAEIPVPLKGRALARLGPQQPIEFQSAYAGAPLTTGDARQSVLVAPFVATDDSPRSTGTAAPLAEQPVTHLEALVDAIGVAAVQLGLPAPRRPWREVLPETVLLDDVIAERAGSGCQVDAGRFVAVGTVDAPELQDQRPAVVDLEDGGGWLVFGTGGSGKTTLLRTVAASIIAESDGHDAAILVFDFASRGLIGLRALPGVIDVATGDDLEAVTRHVTLLDAEVTRRRRLLADAGAEHLTAYRRDHSGDRSRGDDLARIVVLIDGFGGLASTLSESAGSLLASTSSAERWIELVQRIVIDGRQVGIHSVITADRRNAVPSRLHAAISNRLILRHADEGSYAEHGIAADRARNLDLSPGRGLLDGTTLTQVASVAADSAARAQGEAILRLAAGLEPPAGRVLSSVALPEQIPLESIASVPLRRLQVPIGVEDVTGAISVVDLDWSNLTVCGPPRSGRSTALATIAAGLGAGHHVVVIGPARSPLADSDLECAAFGGAGEIAPVLDRLANHVVANGGEGATVLIVDDLDGLDDPMLSPLWERLAGLDDLRIAVSLEQRSMTGYTMNALVSVARRSRRVLVLQPDDPGEFLQITGVRAPGRPGLPMPPGRGVLLADRRPTIVQVAAQTF